MSCLLHIYTYVLDLRFYQQLFVKHTVFFIIIFCLYMTFVRHLYIILCHTYIE